MLRRRLIYLLVAVLVVALGLFLRWPALGLPWAVGKYGGSMLWAAMVYLLLRAIAPRAHIPTVAVVAAGLAALGEVTQLISVPWFDAMRETTLGHLIFGRTFALEDIVAYWVGIALAAIADAIVDRMRKAPA